MIKSMTGFGRCEVQKENRKFTVELKSVNHRYLDVNIRMPKKLNFFETSIRTLLKSYASRGKVDIFITYEDASQSQVSVRYHAGIAGEYLKYLQQMETELVWRMISVYLHLHVSLKFLQWKSRQRMRINCGMD